MIDERAPGTAWLHHVRVGAGPPLLLVHGLGGSWRSWSPVLDALAREREVIAVDLPGFGATPPLTGAVSLAALADAVGRFLDEQGLRGVDAAGSSVGACLVLELARRGVVGAAVALGPGGFWDDGERRRFASSAKRSLVLARFLRPVLPVLTRHPLTRTFLLSQFSARPWQVPADVALTEMRSFAAAISFEALLDGLLNSPAQLGAAEPPPRPIVIAWGRQDRLCLPAQARRATALFPHARLVWLDACGHFAHWDAPQRTAWLILGTTQ